MRWWLHPDRLVESLSRIEANGGIDLSMEESVQVGTRIRVIRYMDRASWKHHTVTKTPELRDGVPERRGADRFVFPYTSVRAYTTPLGGKLTSSCDCRIEFTPHADGTDILGLHEHILSGMSNRRRRIKGDSEQRADEQHFDEMLVRCPAATA